MTRHPYEGDLRQIADRMLNCDTSGVGLDEPLIEVTGMDFSGRIGLTYNF